MRLLALTICLLPLAAFADNALLVAGTFHGDEVTARDGAPVLSLERFGESWMLVNRPLRIERVEDPVEDSGDEKTGKQVAVDGTDTAIAFFSVALPLHAGAVTQVSSGDVELAPGTERILSIGGTEWKLIARGKVEGSGPDTSVHDYELAITDGRSTQVLVKHPYLDDAVPLLKFAGDLDGDAKLDLLIDTTHHYNLSQPTLFLSSQLKDGELVHNVASFRTTGC